MVLMTLGDAEGPKSQFWSYNNIFLATKLYVTKEKKNHFGNCHMLMKVRGPFLSGFVIETSFLASRPNYI